MYKVGDVLTVQLQTTDENYRSKVMDMKNDAIYISYPVSNQSNKSIFIKNDTNLDISFVDDLGRAVYFKTEVIGRINNSLPLLVIKAPNKDDFTFIQRRKFLRIQCTLDIAVHSTNKSFRPFRTVTNDLSAGGTSILAPKDHIGMNVGDKIQCWLVLPRSGHPYHYLKLQAKVVRVADFNENSNIISLQFLNHTSQQEQQVIQFCFDYQLEMRQKDSKIKYRIDG